MVERSNVASLLTPRSTSLLDMSRERWVRAYAEFTGICCARYPAADYSCELPSVHTGASTLARVPLSAAVPEVTDVAAGVGTAGTVVAELVFGPDTGASTLISVPVGVVPTALALPSHRWLHGPLRSGVRR